MLPCLQRAASKSEIKVRCCLRVGLRCFSCDWSLLLWAWLLVLRSRRERYVRFAECSVLQEAQSESKHLPYIVQPRALADRCAVLAVPCVELAFCIVCSFAHLHCLNALECAELSLL